MPSPDVISVIAEAKRQGAFTLTITNDNASPLANQSRHVIDISAGKEIAVAATKSYTNTLMTLALLSGLLNETPGFMDNLHQIPKTVEKIIDQASIIKNSVQRYAYINHCVVLGRGFNYATAFEWALKLKELCYIVAEPYSSADFRHGPIAMLEPRFPMFAIAAKGNTFQDTFNLLKEARLQHGAEIVCISDDDEALKLSNIGLRMPSGKQEWATPMISIILGQLFTYYLTEAKRYDPDKPRMISKVTKTL